MKQVITYQELQDYVSGKMYGQERRDLERRSIENGQSDLLLYAMLLDYENNGTSTDDLIGEDTFQVRNDKNNDNLICEDASEEGSDLGRFGKKPITFPMVADHKSPNKNKK